MCALSNHLEEVADRIFTTYIGVIRVRGMNTDTLKALYATWDGEARLRDIPIAVIQSEIAYRDGYAHSDWTM